MAKYEALTEHLGRVKGSQYPMSFSEIEKIIGDRLPASAKKHRAWWSNNPNNSVMTKAWLIAGWVSSDVDMAARKLVFRRNAERANMNNPVGKERPPVAGNELVLRAIPDETMRTLKQRAKIAGRPVERMARDILVANVSLSVSERLALADGIRAKSPALHDLDVPSLIRDDRDRP